MLETSASISRQYIDAVSVFEALEDALEEAAQVRGGMYWHAGPPTAPDAKYLVRAPRPLVPRPAWGHALQRLTPSTNDSRKENVKVPSACLACKLLWYNSNGSTVLCVWVGLTRWLWRC